MTDHDTAFAAALRARVRDEDPDLDQLIQVSTRTGTRLRRRRTVGISVAGVAAGVTMIGIVGAALGGSGGTPGSEPGFATQPTPAASSQATPDVPKDVVRPTREQILPVHVARSLSGWDIGAAGDDKFPASKGDHFLSVNVRPKSELGAWSGGDSDRPANQIVHIGGNYFVTVQPPPGTPLAVRDELVAALRYQPTWRR